MARKSKRRKRIQTAKPVAPEQPKPTLNHGVDRFGRGIAIGAVAATLLAGAPAFYLGKSQQEVNAASASAAKADVALKQAHLEQTWLLTDDPYVPAQTATSNVFPEARVISPVFSHTSPTELLEIDPYKPSPIIIDKLSCKSAMPKKGLVVAITPRWWFLSLRQTAEGTARDVVLNLNKKIVDL